MLSCLFDGRARLEISLALLVIGCVLAFVSLRALGFDPPCILRSRLVGAGYGSKTDRQAIPSVDGDNCRVVVYLYRSLLYERLPVREAALRSP